MNSDISYCNHLCSNMDCERNMKHINAPGYYTLADLSETELCEGVLEDE